MKVLRVKTSLQLKTELFKSFCFDGYNAILYGWIKCHFRVRVGEHIVSHSSATGKIAEVNKSIVTLGPGQLLKEWICILDEMLGY